MIYRIQNEHCLLKNILRHKKKSCFARIYLFSSPLTIPNWKLEVGNKWFVMFQLWHQKKMKRNDILILHQIISKGETDVQWDWLMLQDIMQNLFISISFGHSFLFKPFLKQQNGIVIRNYFCILSKNKIFSTQTLSLSPQFSLYPLSLCYCARIIFVIQRHDWKGVLVLFCKRWKRNRKAANKD